jgi:hypothetical protein
MFQPACTSCGAELRFVERFTITQADLDHPGLRMFASALTGTYVWWRCPSGHDSLFTRVEPA